MKNLEQILLGNSYNKVESLVPLIFSIFICIIEPFLSPIYFLLCIIIINYLIVRLLIKFKLGILPCSLYLFLVSPGIIQAIVWHSTQGTVSVALLGNDYLNSKIVNFVCLISTISGASAIAGFLIKPAIFKIQKIDTLKNDKSIIISFLLFIFCGLLYARSTGESIIETGGYISDGQDTKASTIGTLNVFYFFFFSYFFIFKYWKDNITKTELIFYSIVTLSTVLYIATRGVRQDSIGFLLAFFAIIKSKKYILKNKSIYYFVLFLFFISWIGSIITGVLRESLTPGNLLLIFQNPLSLLTIISSNYITFNMNTASMTIGTLNVIPLKVNEQGYLLGKSFFDWLPRTFPEFIYPNRPIGPEFNMHYNNEWFGWGGIHETSEIYWNFGYFGVILLPLVISYLLNSFGKSFLRSNSPFSCIPIVWLIMLPRWSWYQLFALYKSTFVMIFLCIFVLLINNKKSLIK